MASRVKHHSLTKSSALVADPTLLLVEKSALPSTAAHNDGQDIVVTAVDVPFCRIAACLTSFTENESHNFTKARRMLSFSS